MLDDEAYDSDSSARKSLTPQQEIEYLADRVLTLRAASDAYAQQNAQLHRDNTLLRDESVGLQKTQDQARRYMEAVYGKSVWFMAPETFENVLERWIWSVANGEYDFAEVQMARIEEMAAEHRERKT
jgi:hypothetical protein